MRKYCKFKTKMYARKTKKKFNLIYKIKYKCQIKELINRRNKILFTFTMRTIHESAA